MAGYVVADNGGSVTEAQVAPSARWKKVIFQKGSAFYHITLNFLMTMSTLMNL